MNIGETIILKSDYKNEITGKLQIDYKADETKGVFSCEGISPGEYAVIFYEDDGNYYVADIIFIKNKLKNEMTLKLKYDKIIDFSYIKIVNIENEQIILMGQINKEKRQSIKEVKTESIKNEILNESEKKEIAEDIIEETKEDFDEIVKSLNELFIETENENILSINEEQSESNDVKKDFKEDYATNNLLLNKNVEEIFSKKLINSNSNLITEYLKKFTLLENELKGYSFYETDTEMAKIGELNIIYNGFIMPFLYPYLGYKNNDIKKDGLPDWIFGKSPENKREKFFIYGILGKNMQKYQPFIGSTGYIYFAECKDGYGYWLMYLSEKTGKISMPLKPR